MDDLILQVSHLSKSFGTHEVLRDIDFTVNKGDVTSIIGASGSGKSTLLRCINLLETPTIGRDPLPREERRWAASVNAAGIPVHGGHGVPVFQPVQQYDRAGKLHGGPDEGAEASTQGKRRRGAMTLPGARWAWPPTSTPSPGRSPAARSSGWPLPGPWPCTRRCCSSTSPPPPWTPRWWARCCPSCRTLAQEGMTMLVVTHEMAFARDVSNHVVYMANGVICEQGSPAELFGNPQKQETRDFLARFTKE